MVEIDNGSGQNQLPDYKRNWTKIKDQLPKIFLPSDWKDVLDSILVAWRDSGRLTDERVRLFGEALNLPNIPGLELADAKEYLDNTKKDWDKFAEGINGIANGVKFKWAQMKELSAVADKVKDINADEDIQAIAMLQAISETCKKGRTPKWIRQRLAQHAFEEIVETGAYRTLDYSGENDTVQDRTTQDSFADEKSELVGALGSKLWNEKTVKEKTADYKRLRSIILRGDNSVDEDTADSLESLWKAANGQGVTKKSALHFLQLGEDVYSEMESGGAFDVEISDEDEDDEEE